MRRLTVTPPETARGADRALGRLAGALDWLAGAQGAWPPRPPAVPHRLVVDGATEGDIATGITRCDALADAGCDLLVVGADLDAVPGLVVLAALLDLEPVQAVGTATGPAWAAQVTGVRDGLRAARLHLGDPEALLDAVGNAPLAVLTGALAQAAVRRTPVLLDGSAATAAAAVLAHRLAPSAAGRIPPAPVPPSPAARKGLAEVGLTGLLDLGLAGPAGADLARDLLVSAVALVTPTD